MKKSSNLEKFNNNNIVLFICTILTLSGTSLASIYVLFSGNAYRLMSSYLTIPDENIAQQISLKCAINVALIITLFLLVCCLSLFILLYQARRKLKVKSFYIDDVKSSKRMADYEALDDLAEKDIYIMGVGLGNIFDRKASIKKILARDIHIVFLLLLPLPDDNNIYNYVRDTYAVDLSRNVAIISDLKNFIDERLKRKTDRTLDDEPLLGKIELRQYAGFLPINITIADLDKKNSSIVMEYFMPFSEKKRVRFKVPGSSNEFQMNEINNNAKIIIRKLIQNSVIIAKDY